MYFSQKPLTYSAERETKPFNTTCRALFPSWGSGQDAFAQLGLNHQLYSYS